MSNASEVELYFKLKQRETDFAQSLTCAVSPFQYLEDKDKTSTPEQGDRIDGTSGPTGASEGGGPEPLELGFDGYSSWYREMKGKVRQRIQAQIDHKDIMLKTDANNNSLGTLPLSLVDLDKQKPNRMESIKSGLSWRKKKKAPKNDDDQLHIDFLKRHLHVDKPASKKRDIITNGVNNIAFASSSNIGGITPTVQVNGQDSIGKPDNNEGNNNNSGSLQSPNNSAPNEPPGISGSTSSPNLAAYNGKSSSDMQKDGETLSRGLSSSQEHYSGFRVPPRRINSSQNVQIASPGRTHKRLNSSQNQEEDMMRGEETNSFDTSYYPYDENSLDGGGQHDATSRFSTSPNSQHAQGIRKIGGKILSFFTSGNKNKRTNETSSIGQIIGQPLSGNSSNQLGSNGTSSHFITRTHSQSSLMHSSRLNDFGVDHSSIYGAPNSMPYSSDSHVGSHPPLLNRSQSHISLQTKTTPRILQYDSSASQQSSFTNNTISPRPFFSPRLNPQQPSTALLSSPPQSLGSTNNLTSLSSLPSTPIIGLPLLPSRQQSGEFDFDNFSSSSLSSSPSSSPSSSRSVSPMTSPEPSPRQTSVYFKTIHISHPKKPPNNNK
eukprot:gene10162-11839_t